MAAVRARTGGEKRLAVERGCLVVADISGYTGYVVESPLEHAEDVLADVTGTVSDRLARLLHVNKLEGDAVFGYALEGETDASMLLDGLDECYFAFRRRLEGMGHSTSCGCKACAKLPDLDLKFVVHYGTFIRRPGRGGEELTGHDVIVVHRLLKNAVTETVGLRGYALLSEQSVEALGIDAGALALREHREEYPDVGEVGGFVLDLDQRFREEKERRRVFVADGEAVLAVARRFPATAPVVWEYLTSPAKRTLWTGGRVEEETEAGRRGPGTTFCADGRSMVYEEILDWRPFHYFTEMRSLPRSAKAVVTTELAEDGDGTLVTTRGRPLDRRGRLARLVAGRRLVRDLRHGYDRLAATLAS